MKKKQFLDKLSNESAVNFGELFNKFYFISFNGKEEEERSFLLTRKIFQDVLSKVLEIQTDDAKEIVKALTFFDDFLVYDFFMSLKTHVNRIVKRDSLNTEEKIVKIKLEKGYEKEFVNAFYEVVDGFINGAFCPACVFGTVKKLFGKDTGLVIQLELSSLEKKKFVLLSLANRSNVNILLKNPKVELDENEVLNVVPIKMDEKIWELLTDAIADEYELNVMEEEFVEYEVEEVEEAEELEEDEEYLVDEPLEEGEEFIEVEEVEVVYEDEEEQTSEEEKKKCDV